VGPSNEAKKKRGRISLTPFVLFPNLTRGDEEHHKSHLLVGKLLHLGFWIEAKGSK
jgi:hypothetical protein